MWESLRLQLTCEAVPNATKDTLKTRDRAGEATLHYDEACPSSIQMRIGMHEVDPTPIAPGGGAQGVYRGIDGLTGQQIAVKVLGAHASKDPAVRNKFEAEFALLESFVHPFSATGYRWDEDPDHGVFFTMPFFAGGDWHAARRDASPVSVGVLLNRWVEVVSVLIVAVPVPRAHDILHAIRRAERNGTRRSHPHQARSEGLVGSGR